LVKTLRVLPQIGITIVQGMRGVNSHSPHIYLNAGLAKIEEAERKEDENQEFHNGENDLKKQSQQKFYIFDV